MDKTGLFIVCPFDEQHTVGTACVCVRVNYPLLFVCHQHIPTKDHMCDYTYERITDNLAADNGFYLKAARFLKSLIDDGHKVMIQYENVVSSAMQAVVCMATYMHEYDDISYSNALKTIEDQYSILNTLIYNTGSDSPQSPPSMTMGRWATAPLNPSTTSLSCAGNAECKVEDLTGT
jgi:hypothetical protein